MAVNILAFGDLHYSFDPPASRKPTYRSELDAMLREIRGTAKMLKSSAIVSAGDHFHRKGRTSHAEVRSLMELYRHLGSIGVEFLSIPGNHDMIGHNVKSATETQPLGVLQQGGVVTLVSEIPVDLGEGVIVVGIPYEFNATPVTTAAYLHRFRDSFQNSKTVVVVTHAEILSPAQADPYIDAIRNVADTRVVILNGHIHEGFWEHRRKDSVFIATGSIARTSIAEKDRTPCVVSVTIKGPKIEVVDIPLRSALPIVDAFDFESAGPATNEDLDRFVELVGSEGEEDRLDVRTEVRGLGSELSVPEPGIAEAVRLLDGIYDPA